MYDFLRGLLAFRGDGAVVIDVGGVGYRLLCSSSTLRVLPAEPQEVQLFAHVVLREDRHELYGFASREERHLFRQLLLVSGVGPAVALALLSAYEPAVLAAHIAAGESAHLVRVKGVGKRTAERILVELRDRLHKEGVRPAAQTAGGVRADAVLALCSLGLPRAEAERRVGAVDDAKRTLEEIIREALKSA